jgi:hypothetical protein
MATPPEPHITHHRHYKRYVSFAFSAVMERHTVYNNTRNRHAKKKIHFPQLPSIPPLLDHPKITNAELLERLSPY